MGCYDTVFIPCPKCGEKYPAQSKGGDCLLRELEIDECPADVFTDINRHAPFKCSCGCEFFVDVHFQKPLYAIKEYKEK